MIELTPTISVTQQQYRAVVQHYLDGAVDGLARGLTVRLPAIGTLAVKPTPAHQYKNPQTGAPIDKPAGTRLAFRSVKRWRTYGVISD